MSPPTMIISSILSLLSLLALTVLILLLYVRPSIIRRRQKRAAFRLARLRSSFLTFSGSPSFKANSISHQSRGKTPSPIVSSFILSIVILSFSGIIHLHSFSKPLSSGACTAQAFLSHLGQVSASLFGGLLALSDLASALRGRTTDGSLPEWTRVASMLFGWCIALILALVGPIVFTSQDWYSPFPSGDGNCFLTPSVQFLTPQIPLYVLPVLMSTSLALGSSVFVLACKLRHSTGRSVEWNLSLSLSLTTVLLLPFVILHLTSFNHSVSTGAWALASVLESSIGLVTVTLWWTWSRKIGRSNSKGSDAIANIESGIAYDYEENKNQPEVLSPRVQVDVEVESDVEKPTLPATAEPAPASRTRGRMRVDTFTGTPFRSSFSFGKAPISSNTTLSSNPDNMHATRGPSMYLSPLTPISQIGRAITIGASPLTPGFPSPLPTAHLPLPSGGSQLRSLPSSSSLGSNSPKNGGWLAPPPSSEAPSVYSMESAPRDCSSHQAQVNRNPLPSPSSTQDTSSIKFTNPFADESTSIPVSSPMITSPTPSTPSAFQIPKAQASTLSSVPPLVPKRNPDRKMSLYPSSVKSTDIGFDEDFDFPFDSDSEPVSGSGTDYGIAPLSFAVGSPPAGRFSFPIPVASTSISRFPSTSTSISTSTSTSSTSRVSRFSSVRPSTRALIRAETLAHAQAQAHRTSASASTSGITATPMFARRDLERKLSLYPASVRSTETDFSHGTVEEFRWEGESGDEREGWIPIKIPAGRDSVV